MGHGFSMAQRDKLPARLTAQLPQSIVPFFGTIDVYPLRPAH